MSNPERHQRPSGQGVGPDRGYYGAGWSNPQQVPRDIAGQQLFGVPRRGRPGPTALFAPGASKAAVAAAAIAIGVVAAAMLLYSLLWLIGDLLIGAQQETTGDAVSSFFSAWLFAPFAFYAASFLTLTFLAPIAKRSPLPTVLLRTLIGGAGGTIGLMIVGVFAGIIGVSRFGIGALMVTNAVTDPLAHGVEYTMFLLAAGTAAWLWQGRPRRPRSSIAVPGTPGMMPPPDAIPDASIPWQAAQPQQWPQQVPLQQPWPPQVPPQQQIPLQQPVAQPQPWQAQQQPQKAPPQPRTDGWQTPAGGPYAPGGGPSSDRAPQQPDVDVWGQPRQPGDAVPSDSRQVRPERGFVAPDSDAGASGARGAHRAGLDAQPPAGSAGAQPPIDAQRPVDVPHPADAQPSVDEPRQGPAPTSAENRGERHSDS